MSVVAVYVPAPMKRNLDIRLQRSVWDWKPAPRRKSRHARPGAGHDVAQLRNLTPDRYLPYAPNTYRVLATRATHGTGLHSTDPETQVYLASLLRAS
ncbi:hypothetical protein ABZW30_41090 [Kitasatospora sp. NPDC004669]|uniref:hypothetical protein n=1 Tax=Kitasatospora sp. NPDC004669 TaxID=3154555 RepID=UPI0033BCADDE